MNAVTIGTARTNAATLASLAALAVAFALSPVGGSARADQLDDSWTRCISVYGSGGINLGSDDPDGVIAACTQALEIYLTQLSTPALKARALIALNIRGDAQLSAGRIDMAVVDYNKVLAITVRDAEGSAYMRVAVTSYLSGRQSEAVSAIETATRLDPTDPYSALWADIIARRNNRPSTLRTASAMLDMEEWPAPLVRLYLGQTSEAAVLAAANDANPGIARSQVCEANFYAGELASRQSSKTDAVRLLRLAATGCPGGFPEKGVAATELKALSATP